MSFSTLGVSPPVGATPWEHIAADALEDAYASAEELVRRSDGGLVVLVPALTRGARGAGSDPHLNRQAKLVRALVDHPEVALLEVVGPPTKLVALAVVLTELAGQLPAEALYAVGLAMDTDLHTRAVLGSVANLQRPQPAFLQHLGSLAPWTRYYVDLAGDSVSSRQPAWGPGADNGTAVVLRRGIDTPLETVLPGTGAPLEIDPASPGLSDHWGSRRVLEVTFAATDPVVVVDRVLGTVGAPCPVCGRPARLSAVCPFCGVVAAPQSTERPVAAPSQEYHS